AAGPRERRAARERRLDARRRRVEGRDGVVRDHRRAPARRGRRGVVGEAARHRAGRGVLLRRRNDQHRRVSRSAESRVGLEAPRGLRLREQPLHGVHADRERDGRAQPGGGPRGRVRARVVDRGRQRRRGVLRRRARRLRTRARRPRTGADRSEDLPSRRAFARRSRGVPAERRAGSVARARSDRDLPRAAARARRRAGGDRRVRRRGARARRPRDGRSEERAAARAGVRHDQRVGRRRLGMAQLTYRDAVAAGVAQEMERDPNVVILGEDIAAAGGVFKTTVGLLERFGPDRVWDTPISEQAILGAAMGAAMTGLRPVAEIMFSDFLAVCWDIVANQIAKTRYMSDGQVTIPLVVKTGNGGGLRFGAQHSQAVENWAMAIPGLKVVAPSTPADVKGMMAAAIRDPDPVIFFEAKGLYPTTGEVPDGEHVVPLGAANVVRDGKDCTVLALGAMVPRALDAAERLAREGIDAQIVDVRSLVPLDARTILSAASASGRVFTVEENPRLCGWGAEIASLIGEECFYDLDAPVVRITTPHVPLPSADVLEDA